MHRLLLCCCIVVNVGVVGFTAVVIGVIGVAVEVLIAIATDCYCNCWYHYLL